MIQYIFMNNPVPAEYQRIMLGMIHPTLKSDPNAG
jgi:hypothetical protein